MSSSPYILPGNTDFSALGIFNVLNQNYGPGGMVPNDQSGSQPATNVTALREAINAAASAGGGLVFIPCGTYYLSGSVDISAPPNVGLIIAGSSEGTTLIQIGSNDTFSLSGFTSGLGIQFQDLTIMYSTAPVLTGVAINLSDCQNVTCRRVYFSDCPNSIVLFDCTQCGLIDCTISYLLGADGNTMVTINGNDNYIEGCIISQKPQGSGGPAGCIGVAVGPVSGFVVKNTHISDFSFGITVSGGTVPLQALFQNVTCESFQTSVTIQPATGNVIEQLWFKNCALLATQASQRQGSYPGVLIGTAGASNASISDVSFNNCMCYRWLGPGIQIFSGQNIRISAGRYGSCSLEQSATTGAIDLAGAAANVIIEAADCTSTIALAPKFALGPSPYAVSIEAGVAGLFIRNCNLSGYASGEPINVSEGGTNIEVTSCTGYNDQATVVSTIAPHSGAQFNGAAFTPPYFGPVVFYAIIPSNLPSEIAVQGKNTNLISGTFLLAPGAVTFAVLSYPSGVTPPFVMIGL